LGRDTLTGVAALGSFVGSLGGATMAWVEDSAWNRGSARESATIGGPVTHSTRRSRRRRVDDPTLESRRVLLAIADGATAVVLMVVAIAIRDRFGS
jgi:hypothetical protein